MERISFKPRRQIVINILFALLLTSCSTVHIYQTGGPQGRELGNQPSTEWESRISNTFFWGVIRDDVRICNCTSADGNRLNIEEVKVSKNFGFILANIFSLGIWEPVKVSWRCAKPKQ